MFDRMLKWTLTWVLRFEAMKVLMGCLLLAFSIKMIIVERGLDPAAPFVPAVFMFGPAPFYVIALIGVANLVVAWRRGRAMKLGKS